MSDTTPERWLPIPGYEGLYEVSSLGRVRSLPGRFPRRRQGRILKISRSSYGYARVVLHKQDRGTQFRVYRLVALAFIGPLPEGMETRHLDGVRTNDSAANLAYGTPSENQHDSVVHGTHWESRKTHCRAGHEYTPENTYWYTWSSGDGRTRRQCVTCNKERDARRVRVRLAPGKWVWVSANERA